MLGRVLDEKSEKCDVKTRKTMEKLWKNYGKANPNKILQPKNNPQNINHIPKTQTTSQQQKPQPKTKPKLQNKLKR